MFKKSVRIHMYSTKYTRLVLNCTMKTRHDINGQKNGHFRSRGRVKTEKKSQRVHIILCSCVAYDVYV